MIMRKHIRNRRFIACADKLYVHSLVRLIFCFLVSALIYAGQADKDAHPLKNPLANQPAAVDAGKTRFGEACAACHGANAEGGRGPNLVESDHVRTMTDDQLFNTIRRGIPGAGMPAFPLPDKSIWQIVTFVSSISQRPSWFR